jgi:hypothetical protein
MNEFLHRTGFILAVIFVIVTLVFGFRVLRTSQDPHAADFGRGLTALGFGVSAVALSDFQRGSRRRHGLYAGLCLFVGLLGIVCAGWETVTAGLTDMSVAFSAVGLGFLGLTRALMT